VAARKAPLGRHRLLCGDSTVAADVERVLEFGRESWPADQVERWPIDRRIPYAKNSRTHSEAQIAQLAASMKEWGWTNPVLADEAGGVIAGHARILAARQLRYGEVPVMVARGWTDAQKRAYVIADNQLALNAGWDRELLGLELGELKLGGFDLALTGFGVLELGDLLADRTQGLTDPDDAPEAPEHPVSRTGDLWLLGRHRLLCGDTHGRGGRRARARRRRAAPDGYRPALWRVSRSLRRMWTWR
jgi:ParB-like chromosome segregation protein Spo0J